MPELPEVETIVQQLNKTVLHKKIIKIDVCERSVVEHELTELPPATIQKIWRRAKYIIFELDKGKYLLIHLKLTGHFHYVPRDKLVQNRNDYEKFIAARFYLHDGSLLTHNSIRKLGYIKLLSEKKLQQELGKLGMEPLSKEFTLEKFAELLLSRKKSTVKLLLMDQKLVAGVGNIYAQEILYHAGIDPRRKIADLSRDEIKRIYLSLQKVLQLAIRHHGTTVADYVHLEGGGDFQKYLAVYDRNQCPKGHAVKKISIGGRSTSYCVECQK